MTPTFVVRMPIVQTLMAHTHVNVLKVKVDMDTAVLVSISNGRLGYTQTRRCH